MEQVLYRLHVKILTTSSHFLSYKIRRRLEFVCLAVAFVSLLTLGLLHITYIVSAPSPKFNCLLNALENVDYYISQRNRSQSSLWNEKDPEMHQQQEDLRFNQPILKEVGLSPYNLYVIRLTDEEQIMSAPKASFFSFFKKSQVENSVLEEESTVSLNSAASTASFTGSLLDLPLESSSVCQVLNNQQSDENHENCLLHNQQSSSEGSTSSSFLSSSSSVEKESIQVRPLHLNNKEFSSYYSQIKSNHHHSYLFAYERSILMLTQELMVSSPSSSSSASLNSPASNSHDQQQQSQQPSSSSFLSFTILEITINRRIARCFGPKITNRLVNFTKSLDTIIMNWAINAFDGKGYLYNLFTYELLNLHYAKQYVIKKGMNLHDSQMGRRESINARISNNSFLNYYLRMMKRLMNWNQKALFSSPVIAVFVDYFDGLIEIIIESVRTTTIFQFLISWIDDGNDSGVVAGGTSGLGGGTSGLVSTKLWEKLQHYIVFRFGVILSTGFLFFISSTLVSHILRETQERMVRFTFLLQYHVTHDLPLFSLIFTHVTESLVFVPIMMGIYFFLFEFFSDTLVSLFFLSLFLCVEVDSLPFSFSFL
jgi:hypothetical protein